MTYLSNYDPDVFISYCHTDNEPFEGGRERWVNNFDKLLTLRLAQVGIHNTTVYRDKSLQGADYFDDELQEKLAKGALLLAVVSPSYLESEWCMRELSVFFAKAREQMGVQVRNKTRIVKVIKYPPRLYKEQNKALKTQIDLPDPADVPPPNSVLEEMSKTTGYEFFSYDASGVPREFPQAPGEGADHRFFTKLDDLAVAIRDVLLTIKEEAENAEETTKEQSRFRNLSDSVPTEVTTSVATKQTVYLSQTTSDLKEEREVIRRELYGRGFEVLPENDLPLDSVNETRSLVGSMIEKSELVIELIGGLYGRTFDDDDEASVIWLQHEVAEKMTADGSRARIIWVPSHVEIKGKQEPLVAELRRNTPAALLENPLEDLKTHIGDVLEGRHADSSSDDAAAVERAADRVYVICEQGDLKTVPPVIDYLIQQGFDTEIPAFEGEEDKLTAFHRELLCNCKHVLVYHGNGTDLWLRGKIKEVTEKLPGYGRTSQLGAQFVYVTGPESPSKRAYRPAKMNLIRNFDKFTPAVLQPFVDRIHANRGA